MCVLLWLLDLEQNIQSKNSYWNIIQVAIPMGVSIMIPQISVFANTAFLGNFNSKVSSISAQDVLSVAGVAGVYYLVFALITLGLATGMLMLMSRKAGLNDHQGVGRYFSHGIILGFGLSWLLILICLLFSSSFFDYSLHNEGIEALGLDFVRIRVWGLPFLAAGFATNMFFVATKNTPYMIISAICQAVVNIALDYIFIFGNLGVAEMGIEGAAYASVCAEFTLWAVNFGILFGFSRFRVYAISFFSKIKLSLIKEIFIKSSPLMLQFFITIGAWEVFFILIEHLGKLQLAASQVLRSLYGMIGIVVWALAHTSNSMVSNLIGQGLNEHVIPLIKKIVTVSVLYAIIVGALIFGLADHVLSFYTDSLELKLEAKSALLVVLLAGLVFGAASISFNSMLGFGETRRVLFYEIFTVIVYLIYIFVIIEWLRLPLWAAWTSEILYWLVTFLLSAYYIRSKRWITKI